MTPARTVAVLGGGITGLTAAFTLARNLPREYYKIVLVDAQNRLGGWISSRRVPVFSDHPDRETALLEGGPRSIRPVGYKGLRTIELVCFIYNLSSSINWNLQIV